MAGTEGTDITACTGTAPGVIMAGTAAIITAGTNTARATTIMAITTIAIGVESGFSPQRN